MAPARARASAIASLRHAERTRVLVHCVDVGAVLLEGRDAEADYDTIQRELEAYDPELLARTEIIALTKIGPGGRSREPRRPRSAPADARARGVRASRSATGEGAAEPCTPCCAPSVRPMPRPRRCPHEVPGLASAPRAARSASS